MEEFPNIPSTGTSPKQEKHASDTEQLDEKYKPEVLEMYSIPGQNPTTEDDLKRYKRAKEQDGTIVEQAEKSFLDLSQKIKYASEEESVSLIILGLENPDIRVQNAVATMIWHASVEERASLIKIALEKEDVEVQRTAAIMIQYVPEAETASLIRITLGKQDVEVQKIAAGMIQHAADEEKTALIKQGLENPNIEVQKIAAEIIWTAPKAERALLENIILEIINQNLYNPDNEKQKEAVDMIKYASKTKRALLVKIALEKKDIEVQSAAAWTIGSVAETDSNWLRSMVLEKIKQGLNDPDVKVQLVAMGMIECAPKAERAGLITQELENPNVEVQVVAMGMVRYLPDIERIRLIRQELENPNIKMQVAAMRMLELIPEEERAAVIKQGLENPNVEVQVVATEMIMYVPLADRSSLITLALGKQDIGVQKAAAKTIRFAPYIERLPLTKLGLRNSDFGAQKTAVGMFKYAPEEGQRELLNLMNNTELAEVLIESSLYQNKDINNTTFSRQEFNKTGSRTTLVGGSLKNKTIVREIEPRAFLTWQRAYEDYKVWQEAGFDYVPIEPIQLYALNKKGLVDVFSGVLDLSLDDWEAKTDIFGVELEKQKYKILHVLEKLSITHGHTHERNFCLRFFRDDNGKVDFNRVPRLYLIDFDQAVSL